MLFFIFLFFAVFFWNCKNLYPNQILMCKSLVTIFVKSQILCDLFWRCPHNNMM